MVRFIRRASGPSSAIARTLGPFSYADLFSGQGVESSPATRADAPCSLIQPMPWIHQGTFSPWSRCPASADYS